MRSSGILKTWNDERGFGFIDTGEAGRDVFVHIKAFPQGETRPVVGDRLTYLVETGPNGKDRACFVEYAQRRRRPATRPWEAPARLTLPRLLILPAFAAISIYVHGRWGVSLWVPIWYGVLSVVASVIYSFDKAAAVAGEWRTTEMKLHVVSLLGGWPGALMAQQIFRHKTSKRSFVAVFWATVVLNMAVFVVCHVWGRELFVMMGKF